MNASLLFEPMRSGHVSSTNLINAVPLALATQQFARGSGSASSCRRRDPSILPQECEKGCTPIKVHRRCAVENVEIHPWRDGRIAARSQRRRSV
jgi:hypothetical protein